MQVAPKTAKDNTDYLYLRAWNVMMCSLTEEYNVELARQQNAPADALYVMHGGRWRTVRELPVNGPARIFCESFVAKRRATLGLK